MDLIGKTIGQYQIIEQIGRGGMATIFKAYQPSIDRYVAVKVLPKEFAKDPNFVKRFVQEAKAIATLEHPHILPVHDFGTEDNINYMVMRYVKGGTLSDLMGKPLPLNQTVNYVSSVAKALDYAHRRGVVHRDIKPSNILIDEHGEALLTDFGIAKMVEGAESTQLTAAGSVLGTPAYMAPEQAKNTNIDGRSDIYSLGVVLYELLTGQPPYQAETPFAIVLKHMNDPLPPPRQINPNIPEHFERITFKAMAKSPDDRFQTAGDMAQTLQNALGQAQTVNAASPAVAPPLPGETAAMPASQTSSVPANKSGSSKTPLLIIGAIVIAFLCLMFGVLGVLFIVGQTDTQETAESRVSGNVELGTQIDDGQEVEILFEDDFSLENNYNGWFTGDAGDEYGDFEGRIEGGLYQLYVNANSDEGNFLWVEPAYIEFDDFVFSAEIDWYEYTGEFLYGLVFRSTPEGDAYMFEIDNEGFMVVAAYDEEEWEFPIDYTESLAINPNGPNSLTVEAIGPSLRFFINGEEVAYIEDDSIGPGTVGLIVDVFEEDSEMYIEFDNVLVTTP